MILADELGADWTRVKIVAGDAGPDFKRLGPRSGACRSWKPLAEAAAGRARIVDPGGGAGVQVDPATMSAEAGAVRHAESGRSV